MFALFVLLSDGSNSSDHLPTVFKILYSIFYSDIAVQTKCVTKVYNLNQRISCKVLLIYQIAEFPSGMAGQQILRDQMHPH